MILISIIVPIYKVEEYIDRCVNSLINQDYKNIEILLIDDGSPDKCPEICNNYSLKDERIKVFHKENGGLSDARNFGILKAKGEYIIFVDSDDYIEHNACLNFVHIVENYQADIIVGNARILENNNIRNMCHTYNTKGKYVNGKEYLLNEFKTKTMHMASWMNMYNRKFLLDNNLRFEVGLLHEDEQFTPRAFLLAKRVISTEMIFYNYIIRDNSITTQKNKTKNAESIVKICKDLEKKYDKLEGNELKYALKEYLVDIYFKAFHQAKLYKDDLSYLVDVDFLKRNSYSKKNKIRVKILSFNKKLYYAVYITNKTLMKIKKMVKNGK